MAGAGKRKMVRRRCPRVAIHPWWSALWRSVPGDRFPPPAARSPPRLNVRPPLSSPRVHPLAHRHHAHGGDDRDLLRLHPADRVRQAAPRHGSSRPGSASASCSARCVIVAVVAARPGSTCAGRTRTTTPRAATQLRAMIASVDAAAADAAPATATRIGEPNAIAMAFFFVLHRDHARHHLLGGAAHAHDRAVLRRRPHDQRRAERLRARRRLHERGVASSASRASSRRPASTA